MNPHLEGRFDEPAMQVLAARLAQVLSPPLVIHLQGDLGAGKTTLARALIQGLGHAGRVKSPTFGLLEHYEIGDLRVLHLDLYRIADPGELEYLGIPDLLDAATVLLVEWPERGANLLPAPDLTIEFEHQDGARRVRVRSHTARGASTAQLLADLIAPVF